MRLPYSDQRRTFGINSVAFSPGGGLLAQALDFSLLFAIFTKHKDAGVSGRDGVSRDACQDHAVARLKLNSAPHAFNSVR